MHRVALERSRTEVMSQTYELTNVSDGDAIPKIWVITWQPYGVITPQDHNLSLYCHGNLRFQHKIICTYCKHGGCFQAMSQLQTVKYIHFQSLSPKCHVDCQCHCHKSFHEF